MGKPLKPWSVLLIGSFCMGTLLAVAAILLGHPGDALRAAFVGGVIGLGSFSGVAWAVRPGGRPSKSLVRVERLFRLLGILGSAGYAACVWLDRPGPVLVASFCAAFGGFFIATAAEMRLDSLKDPGSFADLPKV